MAKEKSKKIKVQEEGKPQKPAVQKEETLISWRAPESEYIPKDVSWYWLSLILSIVLLALAIWQRNFLFAVFIVIAWLVVVNVAGRFPPVWEFKLSDKGISIGQNKFYSWNEIAGFDIHETGEEHKELIFKFRSKISPLLKVNFPKEMEEKISRFLSKHLPRGEYKDSVADSLSKLVRF